MKRFAFLSAVALMTAACSSEGITPNNTRISGQLSDYFKVVDRSYAVNDKCITIEFERVQDGFPEPFEEGMKLGYSDNEVEPGFVVEFLDKDGNIIDKESTDIEYDYEELEQLAATKKGETASFRFNVPGSAVKFKVSSSFKYHEPENDTDSDSDLSDIIDVSDEIDATLEDIEDVSEAAKKAIEMEKSLLDALF